jgi:hypothetical protein
MKTFHSNGTPIGKVDRMCRWNSTMTASATVVTVPPLEKSSTTGTVNSMTVPVCAASAASRDGRDDQRWQEPQRQRTGTAPSPSTSHSSVQIHQPPKSPSEPMPGVAAATAIAPFPGPAVAA